MNRDERAAMARATLAAVEAGHYTTDAGRRVDIGAATRACVAGTRLLLPDELVRLRDRVVGQPRLPLGSTTFTVADEGTLTAARRLCAAGFARVGVLNFASARNPGGGFLGGSQAQEESLARSSALYASQTGDVAAAFYVHHRSGKSALYTDRVVVSPACPVLRDDEGRWLDEPYAPTFLTCAAPNAGALSDHGSTDALAGVPAAFAQRLAGVLAAAIEAGCDALVLGAWGCGVFRNDPAMVAASFRTLLLPGGEFADRFFHVSFAVLDATPAKACLRAFERAFCGDTTSVNRDPS